MKVNNDSKKISKISFEANLYEINSWIILRLPKSASNQLSSRGLVMVEGTINGFRFQTALEPDGKGSHWVMIDKVMQKAAGVGAGDIVKLEIEQSREWSEPVIADDLKSALLDIPQAYDTWNDITPFARWEWTRWINATKNPDTRKIRIGKALSKLKAGNRRPCCFNSNECTVTYVSNKGVLLDPEDITAVNARMNEEKDSK